MWSTGHDDTFRVLAEFSWLGSNRIPGDDGCNDRSRPGRIPWMRSRVGSVLSCRAAGVGSQSRALVFRGAASKKEMRHGCVLSFLFRHPNPAHHGGRRGSIPHPPPPWSRFNIAGKFPGGWCLFQSGFDPTRRLVLSVQFFFVGAELTTFEIGHPESPASALPHELSRHI